MGLDDLVNKAKDLLGGAEAKTQEAAADPAAGNTEAAAGEAGSCPMSDARPDFKSSSSSDVGGL